MKKLIRTEQIKLLNYIPFQLLLGLYILAIVLGLVIYPLIDKQIPVISLSDLFRFPDVWPFLTWITEPYNILLALIVIMITTNEFSNHTFKTQVIFGLSRREIVTQKLILIFLLGILASLLIGTTGILLGLTHSYKITLKIVMENSYVLIYYFISSVTYMLFALLIAFLIKNTALSILAFLGYRTFLEPVLFLIFRENDIRWYFPMRVNTRLTPLPDLIEIFQRKMNSPDSVDESALDILPEGLPDHTIILLAIGYCVLFIWLTFVIMRRKRLT